MTRWILTLLLSVILVIKEIIVIIRYMTAEKQSRNYHE